MELSANGGKEMKFSFLIALGIILASTTTYAQNSGTAVLKFPQDIEFKGPADKPQTAILYGDPTKPGVFVTRIKFPPGYKDMPHWHPDELRRWRSCRERSTSQMATNGMKANSSRIRLARSTPSPRRVTTTHGPRMVK
jgi:hypothetical protein